jgi:DNA-binding NarL/FixJ family response regulator
MDGLGICRDILNQYPGMRVVIISGFADSKQVQQVLDMGVCCFVPKPFTMATIINALTQALNAKPADQRKTSLPAV